MKTPWPGLNSAGIDGLEWGSITTLAAMSGTGKTAVMNQIAIEAHALNPDQEIAILIFTLEMAARRLIGRTISFELRKTLKDIYTDCSDSEFETICDNILPKYNNLDICYVEVPRTPKQTESQIRQFLETRKDKFCLIMYDHSLLVSLDAGLGERGSLIDMGIRLNGLKKEYSNSQYLILSQLNRNIEDTKRLSPSAQFPKKSDIFGSDALYQFSDMVVVLHDPYNNLGIRSYGTLNWTTHGFVFMHCLKARDGKPSSVIICHNDLKYNRITELTNAEKKQNNFK